MSLISFKIYKEMARMSYADLARGKKGENLSDVSRIPLNMDKETIDFLQQFEQKDWSKALDKRQQIFAGKILPRLQQAVNKKIKESGIEESLFYYLKNGKQPSTNPLNKEVLQLVRSHFHIEEGRGMQVPVTAPSNIKELVDEIEGLVKEFQVISNNYILNPERKQEIAKLIETVKKEMKQGGGYEYQEKLAEVFKSLKRDSRIESHVDALLYEVFRGSTVDSREFWKSNGLDPEQQDFDFTDGRSKRGKSTKENVVSVNPHFFRLYHKLERTRGEPHIHELKGILGDKGVYGYDLKHAVRMSGEGESDDDYPEIDTLGATFGSKETNKNRWDRSTRDWFRHHSHGHFGDHIASFGDDVVWMPVMVAGKEVDDPLYDWMFESIAKDIQKNWSLEGEEGFPISSSDEDYSVCVSSSGKFDAASCAKAKARKVLLKAVREGKLFAPPVPCTPEAEKAGHSCPSKEDRMYKECTRCGGTGKSTSGSKKKGNCQECKGSGVIKPLVYIPHQKKNGRWAPLVNPTSYVRRLDPEKDAEAHQQAVELAKDVMGDHFSGDFDYEVDGVKGTARFPTWGDKDLGDEETLNMGASDFKTFGPSYNKNTVAQGFVDVNSRKGREIISTYLRREEVDVPVLDGTRRRSVRYPAVKDFIIGIVTCLRSGVKSGTGCGGAPGFVLDVFLGSVPSVHEVLYDQALKSLLQMLPDPKKVSLEDGIEVDRTRQSWAASKTSTLVQRVVGGLPGGGTYTRRKGVKNRVLSGVEDKDGHKPDFSDKGFASDTEKRGRGQPLGSGLNKESRKQRTKSMLDRLNLSTQQMQDLVQAATHAKNATAQAIDSVPAVKEDPLATLKNKVRASQATREEFEGHLSKLLLGFGKSQDEVNDIIANFKDDTMEDVLKAISGMGVSPSATRPAAPVKQPVAPKPKVGSPGGLASKLQAIKQTRVPTSATPTQPTEPEKDPKVDWFRFNSLPLNERIEYLKSKLRS